ncbi:RNA-binding protein [Luteolibacter ambystomatis]|uniref:RNA-binding protein n=1 Tax=Luteolibacter ambystomatis TaxID=2824561 RepID=A0A975G5Y2_9BACT|nr:RNA-binding protein [Luteolibacter ambystomatis]QUE49932.1 RNA-binding protein [Luteolibacter ambystomatis]
MIILIRNLDRATDRIQLHAVLRKFGKVTSLDLVMDEETGRSKGFAFANMATAKDAVNAIREMDGMQLGANILRVKKAAASSVKKGKANQPEEEEAPQRPSFRPRGGSRSGPRSSPPRKRR